jgi:hypothetical protein
MNCREAQSQILTPPEGVPDPSRHALLEGHLAHCAGCRRVRDDLAAALTSWRTDVAQAVVPDPEKEWYAVRRRIRGGAETGRTDARPRRTLLTWIALPLGAAAAAAVALFVAPQFQSGTLSPAAIAHVDSVEAPGNNASTLVFVDDKSGWLIVWASDANPVGD